MWLGVLAFLANGCVRRPPHLPSMIRYVPVSDPCEVPGLIERSRSRGIPAADRSIGSLSSRATVTIVFQLRVVAGTPKSRSSFAR
jgi:hypothetical protein